MKKLLFLLAMLIAVQFSYAQWATSGNNIYNSNPGYVGIGTVSPLSPLHIQTSGVQAISLLERSGNKFISTYAGVSSSGITYDTSGQFVIQSQSSTDKGTTNNATQRLVIDNGNVGIGTTSPAAKLDVNGAVLLQGSTSNTMARPVVGITHIGGEIASYSSGGVAYDDGLLRLSAGGGTNTSVKTFIDLSGYSTIPDMDRNIVLGTGGAERMRINLSGNIAIGTADPQGHKLAVNGDIIATKITVKPYGNWPDYVFKSTYNLPSLSEVKTYINQNQHLPDMPSEQEVAKNGIDLGEIVKLQTKKIEELTLYLIEKDKEIDDMKASNKQEIDQLKQSLEALTKEIHKN